MDRSRSFEIDAFGEGRRLDVFLAAVLGASRGEVRRLLDQGRVHVDGRAAGLGAKGRPLRLGARVRVADATPERALEPVAEPSLPLRVLASGAGWIAVDKPAGMPVHPLGPDERGTVLNAVVARYPQVEGVGEAGLRSSVVHRLDVDTSGALLVATEESRWRALRGAFRSHRVEKRYRALVLGHMEGQGHLRIHLAVGQHRPARVRVVREGEPGFGRTTRETRLRWRAIAARGGVSLVEVHPRTGFLHQIRASLAHLGHPILGDLAYGAPPRPGVGRHLLHAAAVSFGDVSAESPDPDDFRAAWDELAC